MSTVFTSFLPLSFPQFLPTSFQVPLKFTMSLILIVTYIFIYIHMCIKK
ncbi:rCG38970 [Rattus norvegicus]|uniref:RCG38970 n=1 Tax=Rattus norvegicus TaxID=10116 RepID=A6KL56_RAT|nr:rCG38970 [Rattus norvegicus]